jgi:hypothetical protein
MPANELEKYNNQIYVQYRLTQFTVKKIYAH